MTFHRAGARTTLVGSLRARWIGKVDGDLRPGGEFRARFTSSWEGSGRIDVCEPPHRLLVTMSPAGRPAADWRTRWAELTPAYRDQERRLR